MKRTIRNRKKKQWLARRSRVARRLGRTERPQFKVYRSSKHIYAQLIDPQTGRTITTVSTRSQGVRDASPVGKIEAAKRVGQALAGVARAQQIDRVVFNRNGFLYHGRVKALAEAAREAGLQF